MPSYKEINEHNKADISVLRRVGFSKTVINNYFRNHHKPAQSRENLDQDQSRSSSDNRLLKRLSLRDRFKIVENIKEEFIGEIGSEINTKIVR